MSATFAALYRPGAKWLAGKPLREQPLKPHVEYLLGLHRDGVITHGGPYADGSGGLVILTADDLQTAQRLVDADPAVRDGVLAAAAHEWARIV